MPIFNVVMTLLELLMDRINQTIKQSINHQSINDFLKAEGKDPLLTRDTSIN